MSLRILILASEVVGFAKTGGLADVAGTLPRALARRGHRVAVVMPFYRVVRLGRHAPTRADRILPVPLGDRTLACRIYHSTLPGTDVPIYFIDQPEYFDRDDPLRGKGLYQQVMPGGYKSDYPDNAERFTFFTRACLEIIPALGFVPEVIHANDWQTGLAPVYLNELFRTRPEYAKIRSLFTIHNIAYQGMFSRDVMRLTGLPAYLFNHKQLEFHGHFNFLKAGIVFADAVNTVSPTYAREIQTPEYGCGLEGLLTEYQSKLSGIVNGIDTDIWDPATDPHLPARYSATTAFEGKAANKAELQRQLGLPIADKPVLGMIARLVSQKGIDLVLSAAPGFLDLGCQLAILGEGDSDYHQQLRGLHEKHPNEVGLHLGFDENLAHLIEAGSDFFLMPSRYEPSGLNQLYSLRYGTLPVVRATGGLADTIVNASEENLAAGTATGFTFHDYSANTLYETVKSALHLYRDRPAAFQKIIHTAMAQDWSWNRSAAAYESLYQRILAG